MTDIKQLPLPGSLSHWLKMRASDSEESAVMHVAVHHHARAVAEHNAEKLRRECDAAVYALANTERSLAAARKARDLFADRAEQLAEALRRQRDWWLASKGEATSNAPGGLTRIDPGFIALCDAHVQQIDLDLRNHDKEVGNG